MILTCQVRYRSHGRSSYQIVVQLGSKDVRLTLRLQTLTTPMTLTLDLQSKILKLLYLRNGRVDSLGMKGM